MEFYFLRHGIAEDRQPGLADEQRRLTEEGRDKVRDGARVLSRMNLKLDAVYSSPYPRASETAEIYREICQFPPVTQDLRLAAGAFRLGELQSLVAKRPASAKVMLVGHEPDLSDLIYRLCGAVIEMKKGGLAYVEALRPEPKQGVLHWLLTPGMLRAED